VEFVHPLGVVVANLEQRHAVRLGVGPENLIQRQLANDVLTQTVLVIAGYGDFQVANVVAQVRPAHGGAVLHVEAHRSTSGFLGLAGLPLRLACSILGRAVSWLALLEALLPDAFKEDGSRFIRRHLGNQAPLEGTLEDALTQPCGTLQVGFNLGFRLVHNGEAAINFLCDLTLLCGRRQSNGNHAEGFKVDIFLRCSRSQMFKSGLNGAKVQLNVPDRNARFSSPKPNYTIWEASIKAQDGGFGDVGCDGDAKRSSRP
jgi:hypothetical protein